MSKRIGIADGLDALLNLTKNSSDISITSNTLVQKFQHIPISNIQPSYFQPRKHVDEQELQELASSIRLQGIIQPIIVRQCENNFFEIIAGERRWRAGQIVGLLQVPVIIIDISDETALAYSLVENIQRKDLNALDEAEAFQKLQKDFKLSHDDIAKKTGRSRSAVSNILRLLLLHDYVKAELRSEQISMGHARALLALDYEQQDLICEKIVNKQLSVRQTEELVKKLLFPSRKSETYTRSIIEENRLKMWNKEFNKICQASVIVKINNSNRKVKVEFDSIEDLENLIKRFSEQD